MTSYPMTSPSVKLTSPLMLGWPSFTTMRMDLSPSIMSNTNVARGTIVAVLRTRMLPPDTVTFSSPNISLSAFALADSISVNE